MNAERKRIYWLDVARVVAIISISLNHAVNRAYDNYANQMAEFLSIPLASTIFKTVISIFSRLGVPLFLTSSGTLLLRKNITDEDGIKRFYKHNYLDLIITSELWYFIMFWLISAEKLLSSEESIMSQIPKVLFEMLKTMLFIDQRTFESMWYIPMILAVNLLIPIFALALKKVSLKAFAIPLTIVFISTMIVPNLNDLLALTGSEIRIEYALKSSNIFSGYFLYIFAGYWISSGGLEKLKKIWIYCGFIFTFLICCLLQIYAYSIPTNYLVSHDYEFSLMLICAMFLFELIRRTKEYCETKDKTVSYISKIAFAIYFVHIIIMTIINKLPMIQNWPRPLLLVFLEVVSVGLSIVFIWIFSHNKFCKRRLFLIKD